MPRKVFLITGFNNWGKTNTLKKLFGVAAFRKGKPYSFAGFDFLVLPNSNDDVGELGYYDSYRDRMEKAKEVGFSPKYIASAFCPTREPGRRGVGNLSDRIIRKLYGKDQVEMILLVYKWCGHAKLIAPEIEKYYASMPNVTIHRVTTKNSARKLKEVEKIFKANLP